MREPRASGRDGVGGAYAPLAAGLRIPGGSLPPAAPILLLALTYGLLQVLNLPAEPLLDPDSAGYLHFYPARTAGYPAFLAVFGTAGAVIAQPLLYAAALGLLGWSVLSVTGSLGFALGIPLGAMLNRDLNHYHGAILTESLFASLLTVFLACLLRYRQRPGRGSAAAAGLVAGLACAVRPGAYALLPLLPAMVWLRGTATGGSGLRLLLAALIPALLVLATERIATAAVHGDRATSLAGRHFFAKAGVIEAPPAARPESDPVRARLRQALETDFAGVRELVNAARAMPFGEVIAVAYENCLEWACVTGLRRDLGVSEAAINRAALAVGLERIGRAPFAYLELVWRHYRNLWLFHSARNPVLAPGTAEFLAARRPLPFEAEVPELLPAPSAARFRPPRLWAWALDGLSFVLALGAVAALVARVRLAPAPAVAGLAALTVQGSLLLVAFTGLGISRYMVPLWPATVTAAGLALWWAWTAWRPAAAHPA